MEDELLAIMDRSPYTQKFLQHRAKEIILDLISVPIIQDL